MVKDIISLRNGGQEFDFDEEWMLENGMSNDEKEILKEAVFDMWCAEMADNYHQTLSEQEEIKRRIKGLLDKYDLKISYGSVWKKVS